MDEQTIFLNALEKSSPEERSQFLDSVCAGDSRLRQRIETLVKRHSDLGSFLEHPLASIEAPDVPANLPRDTATLLESTCTATLGTVIGPYTIRQKLGEGGFGVVYLAEQTHPVRRKVALKIIKPGMDTKECIARFEAERQALALMDHPNIANVLEAGTTASGHPYFVMELVRGVPITEFCDKHRMPLRERLALFVSVCQAVQHAHQKGIIHRDLKPSNILVAEDGGPPVVKVIDFGIAKALGQQLTANTLFTDFGQMIGTPLYMSPEQADMNVMDVDTRSDIYSLGVLLYELMTGRTPLDRHRLKQAALEEVRRIIRDEDPPSLSRRLSSLDDTELSSISELRGLAPRRLLSMFHGELDWVAMKALEKDRTRRYETAVSFAADIERYLTDQPVQARPASTWYRFRKFVVRHIAGTAVTATIALGVIAAITGLIVSNQLITRERDVKEQALFERESALSESRRHEQQAQANADRAEANQAQALANATLAERERDDKARQLYLAHMKTAFQEWTDHNADRTRELLDLYLPENRPGEDFREWEWNYLWRMSHSELRRIETAPHDPLLANANPDCDISLAFSPDGRFLFTGSGRGTLRVRTSDGTQELRSIQAHQGRIWAIAVSADGTLIATASVDATVKLWSTANWTEKCVIPGHTDLHYTMALSPAGDRIAVALNETVIYDTSDGGEIRRLPLYPDRVRQLQFSSDGRQLVSGVDDGWSRLWDIETGLALRQVEGGYAVAISPDSRTLVTGNRSGIIAFWDSASGQQIAASRQHDGEIIRIAFSADGHRVVTVGADTVVCVWDANARRVIHSFLGHGARITDVAFTYDVDVVASCGWDRTIRFWDAASHGDLIQCGPRSVDGVVFSPDSAYLAAGTGNRLMVFYAASWRLVWETDEGSYLARWSFSVGFDETGRLLATGRNDGTIRVRNSRTGELIKKLQTHEHAVTSLLFLSDGRIVTGDISGEIAIWSAIHDGCQELNRRSFGKGSVGSLAVSPDGRFLAVGGNDEDLVVSVWDLAENRLIQTLAGHQGHAYSLNFSRDGQQLTCGASDSHLTCWDLATGQIVRRQNSHSGSVFGASLSPNGRRLATCSDDRKVKVWDTETGMEVITLKPELGNLSSIAFSPDSSRLAVSGHSGGFVIYDTRPLTPDLRAEPWVADLKSRIQVQSLRDQASVLETEWKLRDAISALEQIAALPWQQTDHNVLRDLYARTLQWEKALEANQAGQNGVVNWQQLALLYEAGRHDEYRLVRQRLLADSGRVDPQGEIHVYLVAALLLPIEPEQDEVIRRLANGLIKSELPWERANVGKAMYRLGEFDRWYAELPGDSPLKSVQWLPMAITAFQTDPSDEHRQQLDRRIRRLEDYERKAIAGGVLEKYWHNHVDNMAWVQEAKRVLDESKDAPD